jgi:hypothetical protein
VKGKQVEAEQMLRKNGAGSFGADEGEVIGIQK